MAYKSISRTVIRMIRELAGEDSIVRRWENTVYGDIQKITNPKKGVLGERLVGEWLDELGYLSEEHGYNRRQGGGNFDLLVLIDDQLERIEVKLATQDVGGKYQFNWIPIDSLALVVLLGIDPDSVHLAVKTRGEILDYWSNPTPGRRLTPVPPHGKTHVKWTVSKKNAEMVELKTLDDVKFVFDSAIEKFRKERA